MKKQCFTLAVIMIFGAFRAPCIAHPTQRDTSGLVGKVDALFSRWNAADSPGGAIVLVDNGKVVITRCYGSADIEHCIPIRPTTRFELASVSKHFTAFAVLILEKAGKLSLDDRIQDYLNELPDYGSPITIADLLHHTSGLSDWVDIRPYAGRGEYGNFGIEDLLSLVARQRMLEFKPGTKWSYSNTNYALLAEIVTRVTEKPFAEWMQENVFAPLEMHDTSVPVDGSRVIPNRANAYRKLGNGEFRRSLVEGFKIPGPAHVFSTMEDMAKWVDNFQEGSVGGTDVIERMQIRPTLRSGEQSFYAAGLGILEYRGIRTAGHSGQTGGFKSEFVYCPDLGVGVVVAGNVRSLPAHDIAYRVLDHYLASELQPPPEPETYAVESAEETPTFTLDPVEYERFLGGYRLDADSSVLVAAGREGDWLVGAIVGEGMDFFRPIAKSEFESRSKNCRLSFFDENAEAGTGRRVRITLRGNEMWATRVPIAQGSHWIDECAGFYYSDELEVAYKIVQESKGLSVHIPDSESRPLTAVDVDILFGGIGILTFLRNDSGHIIGFDFSEPEELNQRTIRFDRLVKYR